MNVPLKIYVGGGWTATSAEMPERTRAPILLVTLSSGADQKLIRMDLDKKMFIDPMPVRITVTSTEEIANAIIREIGQRRWC